MFVRGKSVGVDGEEKKSRPATPSSTIQPLNSLQERDTLRMVAEVSAHSRNNNEWGRGQFAP